VQHHIQATKIGLDRLNVHPGNVPALLLVVCVGDEYFCSFPFLSTVDDDRRRLLFLDTSILPYTLQEVQDSFFRQRCRASRTVVHRDHIGSNGGQDSPSFPGGTVVRRIGIHAINERIFHVASNLLDCLHDLPIHLVGHGIVTRQSVPLPGGRNLGIRQFHSFVENLHHVADVLTDTGLSFRSILPFQVGRNGRITQVKGLPFEFFLISLFSARQPSNSRQERSIRRRSLKQFAYIVRQVKRSSHSDNSRHSLSPLE